MSPFVSDICKAQGYHCIVWCDVALCCEPFPRVYGDVDEQASDTGGLTKKRAEDAANTPGPAPTRLHRAEHQ